MGSYFFLFLSTEFKKKNVRREVFFDDKLIGAENQINSTKWQNVRLVQSERICRPQYERVSRIEVCQ